MVIIIITIAQCTDLLTHACYTQDTRHFIYGTEAARWQQTVHRLR